MASLITANSGNNIVRALIESLGLSDVKMVQAIDIHIGLDELVKITVTRGVLDTELGEFIQVCDSYNLKAEKDDV
jgi:hypothetical protein